MNSAKFSKSEWLRYTRHIQLPHVGASGQHALKTAKILVIGAGGLGSPVLLYLASAGIGHITIVDHDTVDITNLQRQILFNTSDIDQPKADIAKQHILALNPEINVVSVSKALNKNNADELISNADIVLDCTDNFSTRYLINDKCTQYEKPWVYGSIYQFSGQCALFMPGDACFRCVFPEYPTNVQDCNDAGVLGVLPGLIGTLQANEAIKYLCGLNTPLKNHLLLVDALHVTQQKIALSKDPHCICCGTQTNALALSSFYNTPTCSLTPAKNMAISALQFNQLKTHANTKIIDVRTHAERALFDIGGEHIPLAELELHLTKFDTNATYLCYCQSGKRSESACKKLIEAGLQSLSLEGGIVQWLRNDVYTS